MLNQALDTAHWRDELARRGRVQVPSFLQPEAADRLHGWLDELVPWTLALRSDEQSRTLDAGAYAALTDDERGALVAAAARDAGEGFSFAYESYQMITSYIEQRDPELPLHRVTEFLNSEPYIAWLRQLTGDSRVRKVDCQATCYRAGHFLTRHDDRYEDEGRLFAYVLGLTRRWHADWGGLLQFLNPSGEVVETFLPRFNTLSIFRVPIDHCVSIVAPFASEPRFSITGWLRAA